MIWELKYLKGLDFKVRGRMDAAIRSQGVGVSAGFI